MPEEIDALPLKTEREVRLRPTSVPGRLQDWRFFAFSLLFAAFAAMAGAAPVEAPHLPASPSVSHWGDASPAPADGMRHAQSRPSWKLKTRGYLLSLWTAMNDVTPYGKDYILGTNRFRLDLNARRGARLNVRIVADLELFAGSLVRSPLWASGSRPQDGSAWDLDGGFQAGRSLYFRHSLYRACMTWESERTRVDIGKQRIAWGCMRFWRPTDVFNPESPLQIETGERLGVDAMRFKRQMGPDADLEAVYALGKNPAGDSAALRYHFLAGDYDISVLGGGLDDTNILGFTFDGYIGEGGFRGEAVRVDEDGRSPYWICTIGASRALERDRSITVEYLVNGGATPTPTDPFRAYTGILKTSRRSLLGLGFTFRGNPLLDWTIFSAYDVDGGSYAFFPRLRWSFREDRELSAGIALFGGSVHGEYGGSPRSLFAQVKIFF